MTSKSSRPRPSRRGPPSARASVLAAQSDSQYLSRLVELVLRRAEVRREKVEWCNGSQVNTATPTETRRSSERGGSCSQAAQPERPSRRSQPHPVINRVSSSARFNDQTEERLFLKDVPVAFSPGSPTSTAALPRPASPCAASCSSAGLFAMSGAEYSQHGTQGRPSAQNGVRNRLPTLDEVLLRKTAPPVDLFCFYVRPFGWPRPRPLSVSQRWVGSDG